MIRSSALLSAVAIAILVAGVSAANLGLIYLSIAVSILAAITLAVGVLLRRRELFGEAGAAAHSDQPGWATAETTKARPVPARPAVGDRVTADRGGRRGDDRRDGEQPGDLAAGLRKAGSGTAGGTGSARWPASIAAKGAPATARHAGGHPAGTGHAGRSPASREPAAREPGTREPARGDWAGRERDDREPAAREPVAREATGREPLPTGSTDRGSRWPSRPGRAAGPGRPAERGRDRAGAGRDQAPAAARPDREHAAPGRGRGGQRDRAAAARADRARTGSGRDRDQEGRARNDREQAGLERDEAAAGQQAEAFRLPPYSERTRARAEEPGRAISGDPARDDLWDRVSGELVDSRSQDPARPAWPATAGPRAMGAGSAARRAPGETGDEPEEAGVQHEPERQAAGAGEPDDGAARAGAAAEPAVGSAWSAWSSARTGDQSPPDHGTGAAAGVAAVAAGETGDHEAEAGVQGAAAAVETADRAEPGGAAPGEAERPGGSDDAGETAGSIAEAESTAEPGGTRDAAGAADAGDAGESDGAAGADAGGSSPLDDEVTAVPGVPRYHRRGCILIRFLSDDDLETTTRRAAEAGGSVPCKACQPDKPA